MHTQWASLFFAGLLTIPLASLAQGPSPQRVSQWDGVYSDEQAERGHPIYDRTCARCHGFRLEGMPVPQNLERYSGQALVSPALVGDQFASNWDDLSLGDLFERMRISMPQNNPGSLSRQQNADILAFMLQYAGYPSGLSELPIDTGRLMTIDFVRIPR